MKKIRSISIISVLLVFILIGMFSIKTKAAIVYSEYLNGKSLDSGLVYEPTLVLELNDLDELNSDANKYVTSLILTIDNDINVILGNQSISFTSFYDEYVKGKYIPIVRVDKNNYQAFKNYYKNVYTIYDLMIISSDLDIIGSFYNDDTCYIINSVYDMSDIKLPSGRYSNWEYVSKCNKVGCNILMADAHDENLGVLCEYVQAMTKVCWAKGDSLIDSINTISKGCFGVVNKTTANLVSSISYFRKTGWSHAQYIGAHRGITKYCNENSLTSCMAAYSEGATHIEVDLQVLNDDNIVLCHNSQTNFNSDKNGWYFVNLELANLKKAKLNDYNINYSESYSTLEELIKEILKTDIIMILELKFDNGSIEAVDNLKCIENFKRIMDSIPEAYGHFYAITFFAPLAEKMKELMPEVPLGYIGGARSGKETSLNLTAWGAGGGHKEMMDYANKIKFLRHYNIGLDENYEAKNNNGEYYSNLSASFYLARGYVQNTWTYEDLSHFAMQSSICTSNVVEEAAYLIKAFANKELELSRSEFASRKVIVKTYSYNGWMSEKECEIIVIEENDNSAKVLLYYYEEASTPYGLYSEIINIKIK